MSQLWSSKDHMFYVGGQKRYDEITKLCVAIKDKWQCRPASATYIYANNWETKAWKTFNLLKECLKNYETTKNVHQVQKAGEYHAELGRILESVRIVYQHEFPGKLTF